jgi:hypothetical protein
MTLESPTTVRSVDMILDVAPNYWGIGFIFALLIATALIGVLLVLRVLRQREEGAVKRPVLTAILLVLLVFMASATGMIIYDANLESRTYTFIYRIEVESNGNGTLLVPVTTHPELRGSLRVTEGTGSISIVDTPYGEALQVEYDIRLVVRGSHSTTDWDEEWEFTLAQEVNESTVYNPHWVHYQPGDSVWEMEINTHVDIVVERVSPIGSSQGLELEADLVEEWQVYPVYNIDVAV